MRKSQFLCWSEELLDSYWQDLLAYQKEYGNPVTLKYAYMMKYTSPAEYADIAGSLPAVSKTRENLVEKITRLQTVWTEDFYAAHPGLLKHARPIHSSEDTVYCVSSETYLRCELYTYSEKTLTLYDQYLHFLENGQMNLAEMILQRTFSLYGYSSIEEAEKMA